MSYSRVITACQPVDHDLLAPLFASLTTLKGVGPTVAALIAKVVDGERVIDLLFRATHRGTYENDILLGGFVQRHLAAFDDSEIGALEQILELPDNDLADWLTGRSLIPVEVDTPLLRRIRDAAGR